MTSHYPVFFLDISQHLLHTALRWAGSGGSGGAQKLCWWPWGWMGIQFRPPLQKSCRWHRCMLRNPPRSCGFPASFLYTSSFLPPGCLNFPSFCFSFTSSDVFILYFILRVFLHSGDSKRYFILLASILSQQPCEVG